MENASPDDHLFRILDVDESDEAQRLTVAPSPYTGGPWNPDHQHGGAVSALVAHCVERMPMPAPMRLARLTIDLFRGVPLTSLRTETRLVRAGRRIQSIECTVFDGDTPVTRASALRVRRDDSLDALEAPLPLDPDLGAPPETVPDFQMMTGIPAVPGFVRACELVPSRARECGEVATAWGRMRCPIIEGEETSPTLQMAALADMASGTGNAMDYEKFTSVNPDLSIQFLRDPAPGWVAIRGVTGRSADGLGMSSALLHDESGAACARATASLLLDRR